MRIRVFNISIFLFGFFLSFQSTGIIPHPDHVVVLVLENHSYNQIVNSSAAPYINNLINDSKTALFTQSFGLTHPSQPNYLQLFSGSTQGITSNLLPTGLPFTTPNLGAELLAVSKTFIGYSESLPSEGYTGEFSGSYARKHNPWVNWQGNALNGIPSTLNKPFSAFPTNYALLPSVSIVVPNQDNDMHNGTNPTTIATGDAWVQANLNGYIQWAKTHNSLFILTFDEDDNVSLQHILTLFNGQMVQPGSYSNYIDHYSLLRLLEDMFNTTHAGAAATAVPIDYCWRTCSLTSTISANGPLTFCHGGSVTLSATAGTSYLWSNGATTQNITVSSTGNYSVVQTDVYGCSATSNVLGVSVTNAPTVTSFQPTIALAGANVTIYGSGFSGATSVTFNGVSVTGFTIVSSGQLNTVVPAAATSGVISVFNNCGSGSSVSSFAVIPAQIPLSLKLFIEGYYLSGGQMKSVLGSGKCDTVTVELHKNSFPFTRLYLMNGVLNTTGNVTVNLPGSIYDSTYYVVAYNRNTIPTWSSSLILIGLTTTYDFSTSASKAYGSNQKNLGDGNFAMYSGDLTGDGQIDQSDLSLVINSLKIFQSGYGKEDLTGDGLVESSDFTVMINHVIPVYSIHP